MYSHQQNFNKALKWTGELRSRYLHTLAAFRIYEKFRKLGAPNIVGKRKAKENLNTFNQHLYFFLPLQEAARYYFFIQLAKFFDENKRDQSLTIKLVIDFIETNMLSFSKETFKQHHSGRVFIRELFDDYIEFNKNDIKKIRNRLKANKTLIDSLKAYRDQFLAHDDIKKNDIKITSLQIKKLLRIIQDTIDLLYLRLDFSSNIYSNYDEEPGLAIDRVLKALQEHEQERMRKIKEKYKIV